MYPEVWLAYHKRVRINLRTTDGDIGVDVVGVPVLRGLPEPESGVLYVVPIDAMPFVPSHRRDVLAATGDSELVAWRA